MGNIASQRRSSKRYTGASSYSVSYNSSSHIDILFQMWGSVWPKVLPYCLWNAGMDILLQYLKVFEYINFAVSDKGHTFINYVMAFVVVSRVNTALSRYAEVRKNLSIMFTESREIVQKACLYSSCDQATNESVGAKEWRNDVAYHVMILLRVIQAVLDYPSRKEPSWEVLDPALRKEIKDKIYNLSPKFAHEGQRCRGRGEFEENIRVPHIFILKLRQAIQNQRNKLQPKKLEDLQERWLFDALDRYVNAWSPQRCFLTTPYPFPLVQMTRTFLFFYVFTLPFALLNDVTSPIGHVITIFFLTYGYIGLETIAVQLDDPFGDDENDFDNLGMAYTAFEDIYLTIADFNGIDWAMKLRAKMNDGCYQMDDTRMKNTARRLLPSYAQTDPRTVPTNQASEVTPLYGGGTAPHV